MPVLFVLYLGFKYPQIVCVFCVVYLSRKNDIHNLKYTDYITH